MRLNQSEKARECGIKLVIGLKDGTFEKNYRPNHGSDFTRGLEELYRYRFNCYMGSCGCFLMDARMKDRECVYHG